MCADLNSINETLTDRISLPYPPHLSAPRLSNPPLGTGFDGDVDFGGLRARDAEVGVQVVSDGPVHEVDPLEVQVLRLRHVERELEVQGQVVCKGYQRTVIRLQISIYRLWKSDSQQITNKKLACGTPCSKASCIKLSKESSLLKHHEDYEGAYY